MLSASSNLTSVDLRHSLCIFVYPGIECVNNMSNSSSSLDDSSDDESSSDNSSSDKIILLYLSTNSGSILTCSDMFKPIIQRIYTSCCPK